MKLSKKFGTTILTGLVVAALTTFLMQPRILSSIENQTYVALAETFISTFNIVLLLVLTANYTEVYRDLQTALARNLIIVSSALTLYAISSSPVIHSLLGIPMVILGPSTYIPEIFVTVASLTLLYENYQ